VADHWWTYEELGSVAGKRVTYRKLTGKPSPVE
jgi:hypothetical protein